MILLRPTINLYYDKIVDDTPIPNGVSLYDFTKDVFRIPYNTVQVHPIAKMTFFYNAMKVLDVPNISVFSGKETAKNLFYPLELATEDKWDTDLSAVIPDKSINRIKKGKMKLLILAYTISHDHILLSRLRSRLDNLLDVGITKDMIYIVLGDLNRTYRKLFDNPNVYGIDWWQIYAQICYKSRYRIKNWHWVFRQESSIPRLENYLEKENFEFENWKPSRIFTAFTGNNALHNTAFVSELIYRKSDHYGLYSYNISNCSFERNYADFRVTDKSRGVEYVESKKQIIECLSKVQKTIDFTMDELRVDPLKVDKKIFEDSLINIVSGSYSPMFDEKYLDEIDVISPGLGVWRQIAKGHPFMMLGCLNTMGYISNEGYFLPTQLTNHHYDRVSHTPEKVRLMCNTLEQLSSMEKAEIDSVVEEMIPFMKKNKEKFFDKPNKRKFEQLFREMTYE